MFELDCSTHKTGLSNKFNVKINVTSLCGMWHLYLFHTEGKPRKVFKTSQNIKQFRTDLSTINKYVAPVQTVGLQKS